MSMVNYITGDNGCGKTNALVKNATELAQDEKRCIAFVDCGNDLQCLLPRSIRYINSQDYDIEGAISLYGFLSGICASNFDLTDIFVDCTMKIINNNKTSMEDFISIINDLSKATNVDFHFAYIDKFTPDLTHESLA